MRKNSNSDAVPDPTPLLKTTVECGRMHGFSVFCANSTTPCTGLDMTRELCTSTFCVIVVALLTSLVASVGSIELRFISEFLEINNALRKLPNSTNMRKLEWNTKLAELAADAAESCQLEVVVKKHPKFRNIGVATHVMRDTEPDLNLALLTWYSEGFHYDDPTRSCRQDSCLVYTHVMRAVSGRVGCGVQMCPFGEVMSNTKGKERRERRAYVVCLYGNSQYEKGVEVFKGGRQCSACGARQECRDELCVIKSKPA